MKKSLFTLLPLVCALGATPVQAESVDLAELTCSELIEIGNSDGDTAAILIVWIDGYLSGVTGDTRFNDEGIGNFTQKLLGACQRSPEAKVLDISKAVGIQ